jgi:hypothetical protein
MDRSYEADYLKRVAMATAQSILFVTSKPKADYAKKISDWNAIVSKYKIKINDRRA